MLAIQKNVVILRHKKMILINGKQRTIEIEIYKVSPV